MRENAEAEGKTKCKKSLFSSIWEKSEREMLVKFLRKCDNDVLGN